jgi:hypothetical protein
MGLDAAGRARSLPTGESSCRFEARDRQRFASFIIVTERDVLADTYRVRQFSLFAPIAVGGLPGTREQAAASSLSCAITVGTAVRQGFIVNFDDGSLGPVGQPDDPCGQGLEIAERIVAALPPLPAK